MGYKMNLLLLIVAILPLLHSQPIDKQPLKEENVSSVAKNQDKNDTSDESATDGTYVEETYIEVLVPGVPQVNSSFLKSLLNSSSVSSTDSKNDRNSKPTTEKLDSDERVKRENENKKSPPGSFQAGRDSTASALKKDLNEEQSIKNQNRAVRDISDKDATPQNPSSTESVVNENKKSPLASFQAGRDSTVSAAKKDLNNEELSTKNPNRAARDVSDKDATPQNPSSTESVVYITPQGSKTHPKEAHATYY